MKITFAGEMRVKEEGELNMALLKEYGEKLLAEIEPVQAA